MHLYQGVSYPLLACLYETTSTSTRLLGVRVLLDEYRTWSTSTWGLGTVGKL